MAMTRSPSARAIAVGASALIGCGVACAALYHAVVAQSVDGLIVLLSIFSPQNTVEKSAFWPPLLVAGVAVLAAALITAWPLWWSQSPPRGGHLLFHQFAFAGTMVTLVVTLYISATMVHMHYPALFDDPFGTKAAADLREGEAALAAERAREEARRLANEAHNAEAERLQRLMRDKK